VNKVPFGGFKEGDHINHHPWVGFGKIRVGGGAEPSPESRQ